MIKINEIGMTMRVTLSIVPFGDEDSIYEIGRLDIFNKGLADFGHCEYGVIDLTKNQEGLYDQSILHRRHNGAWGLTRKVLNELGPEGP